MFPSVYYRPKVLMSQHRFLNMQYNLSKMLDRRPTKLFSAKDRNLSCLTQVLVPDLNEMRCVFNKIDHDGDGKISPEDLRWMLKATGTTDIDAQVKSMMWAADADEDGFISFSEFMEVHKKGVRVSEIQKAFRVFDRNGDGRVGADELMFVLRSLGEQCTFDACRRMVRRVDKSGEGLVDMDDFMDMMTRNMKLS